MNFDDVAKGMTPELYSRFKEAVELGRWPNDVALTKEQKALCLEALLKYEVSQNMPLEQRTGFIPDGCKSKPDVIASDSKPNGPLQ